MAKIKYDVKNVESKTFDEPKPGVYRVKVVEVEKRDKKSDGTPTNDLHVTTEVVQGEFKGARLHTYIGLDEGSEWKIKEFVKALGLPEAGTLDTDKVVNAELMIKVNGDTWNDQYRARAGTMYALGEATESNAEPGDDPEPDAEPEAAAKEYEGGFEPTRETGEDDAYELWDLDDLEAEAADRGCDEIAKPKGPKAKADAKYKELLIEALRAEDEEAAGGGGGAEPEAGKATSDVDNDYEEWTTDELKEEVERRELTIKVVGRKTEEKLRAAYLEALNANDADGSDPFAE